MGKFDLVEEEKPKNRKSYKTSQYKLEEYNTFRLFNVNCDVNLATHLNFEAARGWEMVRIFLIDGGCNVLYKKKKKK